MFFASNLNVFLCLKFQDLQNHKKMLNSAKIRGSQIASEIKRAHRHGRFEIEIQFFIVLGTQQLNSKLFDHFFKINIVKTVVVTKW